jgi:O-antigen ligase
MATLGARRPTMAVVGLICIDPFSLYQTVGPTMITLPKTALIGMLLGLLTRRPSLSPLWKKTARPLFIGSSLILLTTALSIAQASNTGDALRETLKALEYLALFSAVTMAQAVSEKHDERYIRIALTFTTITVSLLACMEIFSGAHSVLLYEHHRIPRIAGPIEGPNQLSGYLGVMLPVIAAFALLRDPLQSELIALPLGITTLLLTFSRAGVVATLTAIILVLLLAPTARRRCVCLIATLGVTLGIGIISMLGYNTAHDFGLLQRFASLTESEAPGSIGKRSQLWQAAILLWKSHPWLGIGAGNFESELGTVALKGIKTHTNSLYLQSLVEGGIPLLAAQIFTIIASITTFARSSLQDPLALGAMAASIGLALHQIVDLLVFYPKIGTMWWIILALGTRAKRAESG